MKKMLVSLLLSVATMTIVNTSQAQVSVNINTGVQPAWGPAGYNYAEYYYMPDIETYYYVPRKEFAYKSDDKWVFSPNLPQRHSGYDLYAGHKVVLTTPDAYKNFNTHKVRYAKYKNHKGQVTLKDKGNNGNHYGQYKTKSNSGKHKGQYKTKSNNGKHKGHYQNKGKANGKSKAQ